MSDSDDEYGPLQSTWGSQPSKPAEITGWDSLKDPNAKLTEKGLGTGQLHRKGRNFKPIDEEAIIAQRLQKNSSTKKKKTNGNVRSNSHDGATPTVKKETHRKTSLPPSSPPALHQQRGRKISTFSSAPTSPPMRPALTQNRRISRPVNNAWSKPLVDTPFWESDMPHIPSSDKTQPSSSFTSLQSSNSNNNDNSNINHNDTQRQQPINNRRKNSSASIASNNNNNHSNNSNNHPNHHHQNTDTVEEWNPPQIKSDGGWGSVATTSSNGWSNHDGVKDNDNNSSRNSTNQNPTDNNNSGWNSADSTLNQQTQQTWGNAPTANNSNGWNNNTVINNNNNTKNGNKHDEHTQNNNQHNTNTQPSRPDSAMANNGWKNAALSPPPPVSNDGWGSAPVNNNNNSNNNSGGWGSNNSVNGDVDKSTPSWLNSVPESLPERSQDGKIGGRFSNKARKKYSDIPIEVPKPRNYDTSQPVSFPTAVAPPPPPENDHLITINVELSSTVKVKVEVRELDEPEQLAQKFVAEQNLSSPQVLQALVKLISSQKEAALAKKRQRPVRKYSNHPSMMRHNSNYYNNDPSFEYPEYLPTVYNNAPSLTTPFTRRAYY